jgi:anaerobic magnesium-protoporphyrin IX monomethyl ester cyclase
MIKKIKKICFLQPPWPGGGYGLRSQNRWPRKRGDKANRYPLYLCYAATILQENKFEVSYIDSVMQGLSEEEVITKIVTKCPAALFIEPATPTILYDLQFVKKIKDRIPEILVVFGGYHVSRYPEECLQKGAPVDVVVRGELDQVLLNLFEALSQGANLSHVKGISYKKESIVHNEDQPLIKNLDSLPFPDRNLIPHMLYKEGHVIRTPFTFIITARGCSNACTFCLWPNIFFKNQIRYRSLSNVIAELKWLHSTIKLKEFYIDDCTFNVTKERVIEFSKSLLKADLNLQWGCNARVDCVDFEMLKWMKKAGCKLICYGPESASQETLDLINKNIELAQSYKAIDLTKKAGITAHANFMIGFPWEKKEDIEQTIAFAIKLDPTTAQFSLVFPHPGTQMYEQALRKNWFKPGIIGNWNLFEMTSGAVLKCNNIEDEYLDNIISNAHRRFFLRPKYIIKSLLRIRSNEDILKLCKGAYSVFKGKILFSS